jgi:hypothetical protein
MTKNELIQRINELTSEFLDTSDIIITGIKSKTKNELEEIIKQRSLALEYKNISRSLSIDTNTLLYQAISGEYTPQYLLYQFYSYMADELYFGNSESTALARVRYYHPEGYQLAFEFIPE